MINDDQQKVIKFNCKLCERSFLSKQALWSHIGSCYKNNERGEKDHAKDIIKNDKFQLSFIELPKSHRREKIAIEQNNKCNKCFLDMWMGEMITLELEHKDGNNQNNLRENLELLCPNCHALTNTWRVRNKNKGKSGKRISDEEMISAIKETLSIRQALLKLGLAAKGGNYVRAKKLKLLINSQ